MGREGKHVRKKREAKKRKIEDETNENLELETNDEEAENKKIKITFDPVEFIDQLRKDGVLLSQVLGNFWACAKEFTQKQNDIDAVQEYLQHSPQCAEIIDLLSTDKRPNLEIQLIFNCLTCVILRLADDLHHYRPLFLPTLHLLLRSHMRHVYRALNPTHTAKVVMAGLRFLTAVVTLDVTSAQEILNIFKFDHGALTPLFNRRNSKADEDVRICLMRFALAFLISGNEHIIGQFLSNKDFLKNFFKGLVEDRASVLQMFLSTIQKHVVCNLSVTKTQKLHLLNEYTLSQIASIYNKWRGEYDVQDQAVEDAEDQKEAGKQVVRRMVHGFLLEVTTSTKHGINFLDKSLGLGTRNQNTALYKLLQGLKTATTDDLVCELVVDILKTCPDLLSKYLASCPFSFAPRPSTSWLTNMRFIEKIYVGQPDVSPALTRPDKVSVTKLVSMVTVTTIPVIATHSFFQQCIKHSSPVVCSTGLKLMDLVLHKSRTNLDFMDGPDGVWSSNERKAFEKQFRDTLSKVVPDVDTLLFCWERYLARMRGDTKQLTGKADQGSGKGDQGSGKTDQGPEQGNKEEQETSSSDLIQPEPIEVLVQLLKILTAYTHILPAAFMQTSFDFSRLLHGIFHLDHMTGDSTQHAMLQYETMNFLLGFDVGRFRWFKEVKGEGSAMNQLLKVLMTSSDPKLQDAAKRLISQVLKHTGQFDHCPDEPFIWLDAMTSSASLNFDPAGAAGFLQRTLTKVVRNPYPFNDRIMEVVAEAEASSGDDSIMDVGEDTGSVSDAGIAAILDMDEIPIAPAGAEHADQSSGGHDLGSSGSLPCSALLPAALEEFGNLEDQEKVANYLTEVITSILHTQHNPTPACLLVLHYTSQGAGSKPVSAGWNRLMSYCNTWLPESKQIKVTKTQKEKRSSSEMPPTMSTLLQELFLRRSKVANEEKAKGPVLEKVASLETTEVLPTLQQCLLYTGTCIEKKNQSAAANIFLEVFLAVLTKADKLSSNISDSNEDKTDQSSGSESSDSEKEIPEKSLRNCTDGSKEGLDWLKICHVILTHPFMRKMTFDACTARICEILEVLLKHVPKECLEKLLNPFISSAESEVNDIMSSSSADEQHLEVIRGLFASLSQFIPPHKCLSIIRKLVAFSKQQINTVCTDGDADAISHESRIVGLLSLVGCLLDRVPISEDMQSNSDKVDNDNRTSALEASVPSLEARYLTIDDLRDVMSVAKHAQAWSLLNAIGQLLALHDNFVTMIEEDGLLAVCLEANAEQHEEMGGHLVAILVKSFPGQFEDWILGHLKKKVKGQALSHLHPALEAYLSSCSHDDTHKALKCKKQLHKACWGPLVEGLLGDTHDDDTPDTDSDRLNDKPLSRTSHLLSLLLPHSPSKDAKELFDALVDLPLSHSTLLSRSQMEALAEVTKFLLAQNRDDKETFQNKALSALLQSLVLLCKTSTENQDQLQGHMQRAKDLVQDLADYTSSPEISGIWKRFVTTGLKTQYQNPHFLVLLTKLVQLVYSASHPNTKLMPLDKLYHAVVGHSLFLPTMLPAGEESTHVPEAVKDALVSLLLAVSQREPSCCNSVHFTILLGAYSARGTSVDRRLLSLMHIYEKNSANMWEYRPYIWGKEAITQHSARKALGRTLWKQPSVNDVLKLIDPKLLYESTLHFPLDQPLHPDLTKDATSEGGDPQSNLYDPSFLLPLFSHLLSPANLVPCEMFIECNALSFVLVSLSSHHGDIRRAGYHVLACFRQHLEGARFRGRREIAYILEVLRNSVSCPNQHIPPLLALFVIRCVQQMLQPEGALYPILVSYLTLKPKLNLTMVPLFSRLFTGAGMQHKTERSWILNLLCEGLRTLSDFRLCERSNVFHTLLAFCASPLCDKATADVIREVVLKACEIPQAATQLINHHRVLVWLQAQQQASAPDATNRIVQALQTSVTKEHETGKQTSEGSKALDYLKQYSIMHAPHIY